MRCIYFLLVYSMLNACMLVNTSLLVLRSSGFERGRLYTQFSTLSSKHYRKKFFLWSMLCVCIMGIQPSKNIRDRSKALKRNTWELFQTSIIIHWWGWIIKMWRKLSTKPPRNLNLGSKSTYKAWYRRALLPRQNQCKTWKIFRISRHTKVPWRERAACCLWGQSRGGDIARLP